MLSPNPTSDLVNVVVESPLENATFILVSQTGTEFVLQSNVIVNVKDSFSFDVNSLSSGMYMFVIKNSNGEILFTEKLFVL